MSRAATITIGAALLVFAAAFTLCGIFSAPLTPDSRLSWSFYGFSVLCVAGALACLVPRSRPVTLRIIGGAVFIAFLCNAVFQQREGNPSRGIEGLIALGLPGAYVML